MTLCQEAVTPLCTHRQEHNFRSTIGGYALKPYKSFLAIMLKHTHMTVYIFNSDQSYLKTI